MPVPARPVADRFWEKVSKCDGEGCWLWTGAKHRQGYGLFSVRFHPTRYVMSHRQSFELANGVIPDGMCVLHKCDNPPCVRPDHLFLGTRLDNIADMTQKGRAARGVDHFRSKLTPEIVKEIWDQAGNGDSAGTIAKRIGVRPGTVYAVLNGKTWKHVELAG